MSLILARSAGSASREDIRLAKIIFAVVYLVPAAYLMPSGFESEARAPFFLVTAALSVYLFFETRRLLLAGEPFALIAPPVLASFLYFFLAHVLPSVARLSFNEFDTGFEGLADNYWKSMTWQATLALLAAAAMWQGYWWSRGFSVRAMAVLNSVKILRTSMAPNLIAALLAQGIFIAVVAYSIATGTLGMASTEETRNAQVNIQQFLNLALGLGQLSMFLLAIAYFRELHSRRLALGLGMLALAALLLQAVVGLMSGFKSQFFMPFAVAGLAYYLVYRTIPLKLAVIAVAMLMTSYLIVEPYRAYLNQANLQGTANADLISALQASWADRESLAQSERPLLEQMASRFDLNSMSAITTDYVDSGKLVDEDREWLQDSLFLGPLYAYIPRAIWRDKPIYSSGVWFSNNVLRNYADQTTSVGMGPISFLYIVGGATGVALGFLFLGALQSLLFRGLAVTSSGGMIVYLATATFVVMIPSDFGAGFAGFLQLFPFAMIAQYLMLRGPVQHSNV